MSARALVALAALAAASCAELVGTDDVTFERSTCGRGPAPCGDSGADLVVEANPIDHKRLAATWATLSQIAAPGRRLTLADDPINTLGGVLVRNTDNTMRVDNTFEGRLDRLRQRVQQVILERLLPSGFDTGNLFTG